MIRTDRERARIEAEMQSIKQQLQQKRQQLQEPGLKEREYERWYQLDIECRQLTDLYKNKEQAQKRLALGNKPQLYLL